MKSTHAHTHAHTYKVNEWTNKHTRFILKELHFHIYEEHDYYKAFQNATCTSSLVK